MPFHQAEDFVNQWVHALLALVKPKGILDSYVSDHLMRIKV